VFLLRLFREGHDCIVGTASSLGNVTSSKVWVERVDAIRDTPLNMRRGPSTKNLELEDSMRAEGSEAVLLVGVEPHRHSASVVFRYGRAGGRDRRTQPAAATE
jgi:hypothetical protein